MVARTHLPEYLVLLGARVPLECKRIASARRLTLRYDSTKRRILLTMPRYAPLKTAADFIKERHAWLADQIAEVPHSVPFEDGAVIPILGKPTTITHTGQIRGHIELTRGKLLVSGDIGSLDRRVHDWLREYARQIMTEKATDMAKKIGAKFRRISIRDMSTRWGSCSEDGHLSFSWRLVLAPEHILDYIVAHEVAHLKELNHSLAFWRLVNRIHPSPHSARRWLNNHVAELHRYGSTSTH